MKAVFDVSLDSSYDDEITTRYPFPSNYLAKVKSCLNDWVIFRQPRSSGGTKSYFGVARVTGVEKDADRPGMFSACLDSYLEFDVPVPWRSDGRYQEQELRDIQQVKNVGLAIRGNSVRLLADADFSMIWSLGFSEVLDPKNSQRFGPGLRDVEQHPFLYEISDPAIEMRRIEQTLVNRTFREASFRRKVCAAYDDRCAVTGLKIINGGGRAEVEAAHIWSVKDNGPDVVQNGIALSGTVHWLFDRHLISLTDDYRLLISHNKIPIELRALFEKQMDRIHLPSNENLRPHPAYVAKHREDFLAA